MPFEAPGFWSRPPGESAAAKFLKPLGEIYHRAVQSRLANTTPTKVGKPVICIGNISLGGVGKTPMARFLVQSLKARGHAPAIMSRGYGGSLKGPVAVTDHHRAEEVGDEPLMLSADAPVWISKNRAEGAKAAAASDASCLLMDDGFQNPSVYKDFSLLMVDGTSLFGNGEVFPAGPLREKPETAITRAGAMVVVLPSLDHEIPAILEKIEARIPIYRSTFAIDPSAIPAQPLLAFCGIGRPQRFLNSLETSGADVAAFETFADHHVFKAAEIDALKRQAQEQGLALVTTEKDHARLAPRDRDGITMIPGVMEVADAADLVDTIERHL